MKHCRKLLCLLAGLALLSTGCSIFGGDESATAPSNMAVTGYPTESLWNLQKGREYTAAGRYVLAREHYLLALAAAQNSPDMQALLANELNSVDLMIRSLR